MTTVEFALPQKLSAGEPGWQSETEVVVIGSGIAGLTTALRASRLGRVTIVTKDVLSAGSTRWAMGGVAAAIGPGDSPQQHLDDTLVAGAGLCDEDAVRTLVTEGPAALRELITLGAILLDNMSTDTMRAAVELVGGRARLEASGGLILERARAVAETGVDYLAVGALTHSVHALDIALDLR